MISFKDSWNKSVSEKIQSPTGFPGILAAAEKRGGRSVDWHRVALPEVAVAMNYELFLEVAIGAWHHPFKEIFLQWTRESVELALGDPRFDIESANSRHGWKNPGSFPGNHGFVLAVASLIKAIEQNSDPDALNLSEAADEIITGALQTKGKAWNTYIVQGEYLRAVQLLIIAGRTDFAKSALQTRRGFKYVESYRQWIQSILSFIPSGAKFYEATADQKSIFDKKFDAVRDPSFTTVTPDDPSDKHLGQDLMQLRLDLAIIRQKYILGRPVAENWQHIFSSISE